MTRFIKRLAIIAVYTFLFLCVIFLMWLAFFKVEKTCFDGKLNQNEERVDCGGVCGACGKDYSDAQQLEMITSDIVEGLPGTYDAVLTIKNPNTVYGSPSFGYTVFLEDESGATLASRKGVNSILPTEQKYLPVSNLVSPRPPTRARIEFSDEVWQEFLDYEKPELVVVNKRYSLISDGTGHSEVFGLLQNNSPYDFGVVEVHIILKDQNGNILATHRTQRKTIEAFEEWDFRLVFPRAFPGIVDREQGIIIEAETNMFDSQNFVKQYIPGGRFQLLRDEKN